MLKKRWELALALGVFIFAGLACSFSASTANLSSLKLGKDEKVTAETSSFGASDTVYAVAEVSNAPGPVKVRGRLVVVGGEGEQDMLGSDIRGAQRPRLLVGREQGPLGVRRQGRRNARAPTLARLLLELGGDGRRIRVRPFEHVPDHVVLERRVEEVLGGQVRAAPLHGQLSRPLQ